MEHRKIFVRFHNSAVKEFSCLPEKVKGQFQDLIVELEISGRLSFPQSRKLSSKPLFELRIRADGQWRAIYCKEAKRLVIILSFFRKKSQKTPLNEINKATKRIRI